MLCAFILGVGLASSSASTSTSVSPSLSSVRPEDSWWQLTQRKERIYIVVGSFMGHANPASAPFSSLFSIHTGGAASIGYYVHPLLAVETQGYFALEDSAGFFGPPIRGGIGGLRAGVRFALPIYISPIVATHLGYARGSSAWQAQPSSAWFPGNSSGSTTADTLTATIEGGVQFNFKHFTSELLWTTDFNLARRVSGSASLGSPSVLTQMGLSARLGARF